VININEKTNSHLILLALQAGVFLELARQIQTHLSAENDLTQHQAFHWSETAFHLAETSRRLSQSGMNIFDAESGIMPVLNENKIETIH
jgi:hypothetical protein